MSHVLELDMVCSRGSEFEGRKMRKKTTRNEGFLMATTLVSVFNIVRCGWRTFLFKVILELTYPFYVYIK